MIHSPTDSSPIVQIYAPREDHASVSQAIENIRSLPTYAPFSDELVAWCDALSASLFKDQEARKFPELQSLAFWLRRTNIRYFAECFNKSLNTDFVALPRGTCLHIAPSNVDTMSIYSLTVALLAGNKNFVRVSRKPSQLKTIILRALRALAVSPETSCVSRGVLFLSYDHNAEITAQLSLASNTRIIWGGDQTIETIKKLPTNALTKDIFFPDRSSLAVIDAKKVADLSSVEINKLAGDFFNDAYMFDQRACSSPRSIAWIGSTQYRDTAKRLFFTELRRVVEKKQAITDASIVMKKELHTFNDAFTGTISGSKKFGPAVTVLALGDNIPLPETDCGGGLFYAFDLDTLQQLKPLLTKKIQTLGFFGFSKEELRNFATQNAEHGVDRIVPIGQALAFSPYWDGMNLFYECTRLVYV